MGEEAYVDSESLHLEVAGLDCWRNDEALFRRLSFSVGSGQIAQIEGENGSGKTTLLRMICGLTLPDDGEIRWAGQALPSNRDAFHAALNYVGHLDAVKLELTPLENIEQSRTLGSDRAEVSAEQALHYLGLLRRDTVFCRRLSAGQRRRVALARLLVKRAACWVLDEPLTALDVSGRERVAAMLKHHLRLGGMVIFTTHQGLEIPGVDVTRVALT